MTYNEKQADIHATIQDYFDGIFHGDILKLRRTFADTAFLYGDINGVAYKKSVEEYLDGVKSRKSPKALGEVFKMDILSLEILGQVAVAKVHVPMLGYNYYDYLSFSLTDNTWKIVSKVFTHVE